MSALKNSTSVTAPTFTVLDKVIVVELIPITEVPEGIPFATAILPEVIFEVLATIISLV